jgi:hypothetical protein
MAEQPQSFESHARLVPGYHYVAFSLLLVIVAWRLYGVVTAFSVDAVVSLLVPIVLGLVAFYARVFALGAQDRVIRLEEQLRIAALAPDLASRVHELTINQVCALRFASDAEAPDLARKVLDGKLDDRKAIKQMIRSWKPDHVRV